MKFSDLKWGQWFMVAGDETEYCANGLDPLYRYAIYFNKDGCSRNKNFAPDTEVTLIDQRARAEERKRAKAAKYPPGTGMPKKSSDGF